MMLTAPTLASWMGFFSSFSISSRGISTNSLASAKTCPIRTPRIRSFSSEARCLWELATSTERRVFSFLINVSAFNFVTIERFLSGGESLTFVSPLQLCNVDLAHLQHGIHDPLGLDRVRI